MEENLPQSSEESNEMVANSTFHEIEKVRKSKSILPEKQKSDLPSKTLELIIALDESNGKQKELSKLNSKIEINGRPIQSKEFKEVGTELNSNKTVARACNINDMNFLNVTNEKSNKNEHSESVINDNMQETFKKAESNDFRKKMKPTETIISAVDITQAQLEIGNSNKNCETIEKVTNETSKYKNVEYVQIDEEKGKFALAKQLCKQIVQEPNSPIESEKNWGDNLETYNELQSKALKSTSLVIIENICDKYIENPRNFEDSEKFEAESKSKEKISKNSAKIAKVKNLKIRKIMHCEICNEDFRNLAHVDRKHPNMTTEERTKIVFEGRISAKVVPEVSVHINEIIKDSQNLEDQEFNIEENNIFKEVVTNVSEYILPRKAALKASVHMKAAVGNKNKEKVPKKYSSKSRTASSEIGEKNMSTEVSTDILGYDIPPKATLKASNHIKAAEKNREKISKKYSSKSRRASLEIAGKNKSAKVVTGTSIPSPHKVALKASAHIKSHIKGHVSNKKKGYKKYLRKSRSASSNIEEKNIFADVVPDMSGYVPPRKAALKASVHIKDSLGNRVFDKEKESKMHSSKCISVLPNIEHQVRDKEKEYKKYSSKSRSASPNIEEKNIFAEVVPDMSGYVPTRKAALKASAHIKDTIEGHVSNKEKEPKKYPAKSRSASPSIEEKNIFAEVAPDMSGYVPPRKAALKASAHIKDTLEKHVLGKEKESKNLRSAPHILEEKNIIGKFVPNKTDLKASAHIKDTLEKHVQDEEKDSKKYSSKSISASPSQNIKYKNIFAEAAPDMSGYVPPRKAALKASAHIKGTLEKHVSNKEKESDIYSSKSRSASPNIEKKNIFAEVSFDISGYVPPRKAALKASAHIKNTLEKHFSDKDKEYTKLRSASPILEEKNIFAEVVPETSGYVHPRKAALKASSHIKDTLEKHVSNKEKGSEKYSSSPPPNIEEKNIFMEVAPDISGYVPPRKAALKASIHIKDVLEKHVSYKEKESEISSSKSTSAISKITPKKQKQHLVNESKSSIWKNSLKITPKKQKPNFAIEKFEQSTSPISKIMPKKWKRHLTHNKLKSCICDVCDQVFRSPCFLKYHYNNVHEGIKPFKCDKCDKAFSSYGKMKRHDEAVHLQLKFFKCELCQKDFHQEIHLKNHIISIHERVKKFECNFCGKSFALESNMKQHIANVHIKSKMYDCEFCDQSFSHKSSFKRHVMFVHKSKTKKSPLNLSKGKRKSLPSKSAFLNLDTFDEFENKETKNVYETSNFIQRKAASSAARMISKTIQNERLDEENSKTNDLQPLKLTSRIFDFTELQDKIQTEKNKTVISESSGSKRKKEVEKLSVPFSQKKNSTPPKTFKKNFNQSKNVRSNKHFGNLNESKKVHASSSNNKKIVDENQKANITVQETKFIQRKAATSATKLISKVLRNEN